MSPSRTRGGLDISINFRPSKFQNTIAIDIVDGNIDDRVGPPKVGFDQSCRSSLPTRRNDLSVEFLVCHACKISRTIVGGHSDLTSNNTGVEVLPCGLRQLASSREGQSTRFVGQNA